MNQAIRFLMHYMFSNGKTIRIPDELLTKEQMNNCTYFTGNDRGFCVDLKNGNMIECIIHPRIFCSGENEQAVRGQLYYCIGKAKANVAMNSETGERFLFIEDKYEFYPWCTNELHFKDCGCDKKYKNWSQVTLPIPRQLFIITWFEFLEKKSSESYYKISNFLYKIDEKIDTFLCKVFKFPWIEFRLESINISDRLFEKIGKPFYSYAIIDSDLNPVEF